MAEEGTKDPDRASSDHAQSTQSDRIESALVHDLLEDRGSGGILDLGCGRGRLAGVLRSAFDSYVGVDREGISITVARHGPATEPGMEFVLADAARLPFRDRAFSAVAAVRIYHRFERPEEVLSEVERVLRPGGLLVLQVAPRPSLLTVGRVLRRRLRARGRDRGPRPSRGSRIRDDFGVHPGYLESLASTRERLARAGLHVEAIHRHGLENLPILRAFPARLWIRLSETLPFAPLLPWAMIRARRVDR